MRARGYYNESQPLVGMVLTKIEAANYDVLSYRTALSAAEISWIVVRAALR
jgi:hypothetical protein